MDIPRSVAVIGDRSTDIPCRKDIAVINNIIACRIKHSPPSVIVSCPGAVRIGRRFSRDHGAVLGKVKIDAGIHNVLEEKHAAGERTGQVDPVFTERKVFSLKLPSSLTGAAVNCGDAFAALLQFDGKAVLPHRGDGDVKSIGDALVGIIYAEDAVVRHACVCARHNRLNHSWRSDRNGGGKLRTVSRKGECHAAVHRVFKRQHAVRERAAAVDAGALDRESVAVKRPFGSALFPVDIDRCLTLFFQFDGKALVPEIVDADADAVHFSRPGDIASQIGAVSRRLSAASSGYEIDDRRKRDEREDDNCCDPAALFLLGLGKGAVDRRVIARRARSRLVCIIGARAVRGGIAYTRLLRHRLTRREIRLSRAAVRAESRVLLKLRAALYAKRHN